ncbi:MAG: S9 family peptidase [Bacteroidia bacterium]|nr:S9 family peptidase [Bacteroidia bacterium]MDW8235112.1 prolyl oligopeptidase family serine peptidase [Bacteroidia bacterium]
MRTTLAIIYLSCMASAQLPPLLDRELFFGDPVLAGVEVSPDGKWLSFVKPYNGTLNIWLQPLRDGGLGEAFPVTNSERRPITQYFWSPDSKYLLYIQDKDGDENYLLYRITLAEVTPGKIPTAANLVPRTGVLVQVHAIPKDKPQVAYIGINDRDPSLHDLYELELATGKLRLLYENKDGILGWDIDHKGQVRCATKMGSEGGTELYLVERKGNSFSFKKFYETAWDESAGVVYIPRKGKEFYMTTNKGTDKSRLILFDPSTGKEKLIHTDPENRVDLANVSFDDKTDKLRLVSYIDDYRRRYFFDTKLEEWFKRWNELLPGGEVGTSSLSDDERYAVVVFGSDKEPGRYYLWDSQKKELKEIGRSRPDLPVEHLSDCKPVRIRARDGAELPAYLTLPKGVTPRNLPGVLYVHGGPWARDYWGYDPVAQFLANRGYAVLQVNFRGSTGYGKAFINAGNQGWGTGTMQHDLTDAVQQMIKEGIFDPKRVAIMGGSYGGYATLAGVTFTPELYACGVSIVGPSSIITLVRSVPPYWKPIMKMFYNRVGNPDDPKDAERLKAQSPLYHVDKIRVPLLIIQGANDPRVKQQESDQIVAALHAKGYPVRYLLAPDEGHGYRNYDNRMAMMVAIEQFLSERIGGRLQPEVSEKIAKRLRELTVDPSTVKVNPITEAKAANNGAASAMAALSLPLKQPLKARWLYQLEAGGRKVSVRSQEEWKKSPSGWEFSENVESDEIPGLRTQEISQVDAQGQVLSYRRTQASLEIELNRQGDKIVGTFKMMGQINAVEKPLEGHPFYPLGGAIRYYLASLPLAKGYKAQFMTFSLQQQAFIPATVSVEDEEKITVASTSREVWRILLEAEGVKQLIWIEKSTGLPWRTHTAVMGTSLTGDRIE